MAIERVVITTRLSKPLHTQLRKAQQASGLRMEWIWEKAIADWLGVFGRLGKEAKTEKREATR